MQSKRFSAVRAVIATTVLQSTYAMAQQETVLHSFSSTSGVLPYSGVVFDTAGNLYGTTAGGAGQDVGVVYELSLSTGGGWTEKVLHFFTNTGTDGYRPYATPIFDST